MSHVVVLLPLVVGVDCSCKDDKKDVMYAAFLISRFNETAFSTVDSHSYFMSETEMSVRFVFIYFFFLY